MPRAKRQPKLPTQKPGLTRADLLVITDATNSHIIHWTNIAKIITAEIGDADGTGSVRYFSPFNAIEVQLSEFLVKTFHLQVDTIRGALGVLRSFHREIIAVYESSHQLPLVTEPPHLSHFKSREGRKAIAINYVHGSIDRGATFDDRLRHAASISEVWHALRTGTLAGDHVVYLGIHEDESWGRVMIDPDSEELRSLIGSGAIVVNLIDIVSRIRQRAADLGIELGAW